MTQKLFKMLERSGVMWGRELNGTTLWFSTLGYVTQEHMDIESNLIKLGFYYDFKSGRDIQSYDKYSGRTTTYMRRK